MLRLGRQDIDIAAGQRDYVNADRQDVYTYDNSAANRLNPNRPPRRVTFGP